MCGGGGILEGSKPRILLQGLGFQWVSMSACKPTCLLALFTVGSHGAVKNYWMYDHLNCTCFCVCVCVCMYVVCECVCCVCLYMLCVCVCGCCVCMHVLRVCVCPLCVPGCFFWSLHWPCQLWHITTPLRRTARQANVPLQECIMGHFHKWQPYDCSSQGLQMTSRQSKLALLWKALELPAL